MLLAICVCVGFGYDSWTQARLRLAGLPSHLSTHPIWTRTAAVALLAAGTAVCLARTGNVPPSVQITIGAAQADVPTMPQDPAPISAVTAALDIAGEELVELPSDWKPLSELRRDFWTTWCARQPGCVGSVTATEQTVVTPLRAEFHAEWRAVSRRVVDNLPQLDLSGRDLRGASADRAVLSGAVMDRIDLAHAELREAHMEGTVLTRARLVWLQAYEARFDGANLTGSDVRRAQLSSAGLQDASLGLCQPHRRRPAQRAAEGGEPQGCDFQRRRPPQRARPDPGSAGLRHRRRAYAPPAQPRWGRTALRPVVLERGGGDRPGAVQPALRRQRAGRHPAAAVQGRQGAKSGPDASAPKTPMNRSASWSSRSASPMRPTRRVQNLILVLKPRR